MFLPIPVRIEGGPKGSPPLVNSLLIATNVVLFFCGFSTGWAVGPGSSILSLVTHAFVHADIMHLLGNMWILWIFGNAVNRRLGGVVYACCYFGILAAVGLIARLFCSGYLVGSSGAIFGVVAIAVLLLPSSRLVIGYIALLPITLLIGLITKPAHWLGWVIRWDRFGFPMLWAFALVPLIELWGFANWFLLGHWNWTHLAHLLGFVFGVAAVLLLPKRISMNRNPV